MRNLDSEDPAPSGEAADYSGVAEAKRIAARRRFLRMGAGGSAAVLVTVVHKRAFAGGTSIKKGAVVSACVSLGGVADIKSITAKKALEISAGLTLKHTVCYRPKETAPNRCAAPDKTVDWYLPGTNKDGKLIGVKQSPPKPMYSSAQLKHGCGSLEETIEKSYNYRLFKKHYCPVVITSSGDITYDTNATYYDDKGVLQQCEQ